MEVFLTPDAPKIREIIGKTTIGGAMSNLAEKLGEKRDRTSGEDSDRESVESIWLGGRNEKSSKRKKTGENGEKEIRKRKGSIDESGGEGEIQEIRGKETDREEDLYEEIQYLQQLLKKTRNSTREVRNYVLEKSESFRTNIVKHAAQADRQLEVAMTKIINIGLRIENGKLKRSLQLKEQGTQSSPCLEKRGYARESARDGKQSDKGDQRKNRGQQWETDGMEDETEGEEGRKGGDRTDGEREGLRKADNREMMEKKGEEWEIVNRNKNRKEKRSKTSKKKEEEEAESKRGEKEEGGWKKKPPVGPRNEAVIIKASENRTYADLFKQIKDKAGNRIEGIQTIRKSRGGDLVIEMEKGQEGGKLEQTVKEVLGEEHRIKRVAPRIFYEIRDVDPTLEREEIRSEIAREMKIEASEVEIKTVRFSYGGTKIVIMTIPTSMLEKIGEENKIRIGYTTCRIKRTQNLVRCYRCHDFGHLSYNCKAELQGKELCRRCGKIGHQINGCEAMRSCILCIRAGIPAANAEHVAGAVGCPQYKKYVMGLNEGK